MAEQDAELAAMAAVVEALSALDPEQRTRVLDYVLQRLNIAPVRRIGIPREGAVASASAAGAPPILNIRSFTEDKQPQSANEMAAVAAFYLSELAPPSERSPTINTDALRRAFKAAGFRLPKAVHATLTNACAAGYFDKASRGEYRLNPVGYNLVVHGLPRSGASAREARPRKAARRKAAKRGARR